MQWLDTLHMPDAWECGILIEHTTATLLCSDLFTEGGATHPPISDDDIVDPSDAFRGSSTTLAHQGRPSDADPVGRDKPMMLARMHGSAWRGDGAGLLLALADALETGP